MMHEPPFSVPVSSRSDWAANVGCIESSLNPGSPSGWSTRRDGLSKVFNPASYKDSPQQKPVPIPRFRLPISSFFSDSPCKDLLSLAKVSDCRSCAEIPVHPDAQGYFGLSSPSGYLDSYITVSSRTFAVNESGNAAFVKTDYPYKLGQCARRIKRSTIEKSLASSTFLKSQFSEAHRRDPEHCRFALLPESIGYTAEARNEEIGVIFREPNPWPNIDCVDSALIPFFAIPVPDKTGNCFLSWVINSMVDNDPELSHLDAFSCILELLADYLSFMLSIGVLHDSHGQNMLLEVATSGLPRRVVVRDLSHLYRLNEIPESRRRQKVSHLVDSKFGSYVIQPMARRFQEIFRVSETDVRRSILRRFSFLKQYSNLFPIDCWFARDATENLDGDGNVVLVRQVRGCVLRRFE